MTRWANRITVSSALVVGAILTACSTADQTVDPLTASRSPSMATSSPSMATGPSPDTPSAGAMATSARPSVTPRSSATESTVSEPATTNTLPPPPRPRGPAPSTAGQLSTWSLPVPVGWRTKIRAGGAEEGYEGNGTWVRARDPRYAAQDVMTLGCADVTRDDYRDPIAALEGAYQGRNGQPGIGLVLEFADSARASAFFALYRKQVAACTDPDGPVLTKIIDSDQGLIDRRTYPDGEWTEVAGRQRSRLTLIILGDPGHRVTTASAERILASIAQAE